MPTDLETILYERHRDGNDHNIDGYAQGLLLQEQWKLLLKYLNEVLYTDEEAQKAILIVLANILFSILPRKVQTLEVQKDSQIVVFKRQNETKVLEHDRLTWKKSDIEALIKECLTGVQPIKLKRFKPNWDSGRK